MTPLEACSGEIRFKALFRLAVWQDPIGEIFLTFG